MKKIMIVEDDEVIKDELSELLKNSSYLVESVKNFEKAKEEIKTLHDKWVEKLINMSDAEYQSQQYAKWPLEGRSFADTALWLNGELMKNVAEIGYGRFLYAACKK